MSCDDDVICNGEDDVTIVVVLYFSNLIKFVRLIIKDKSTDGWREGGKGGKGRGGEEGQEEREEEGEEKGGGGGT